jgi:hypothetical protein
VMRELSYGPRRRCQQAFHSQWKSQWLYYSWYSQRAAPPLSRAYSMLRLLPYGVTPSGQRVRRRPIICASDLQPCGIFRELLSPAMKILGISMDIYGLSALRFAQGTRHRDLDRAIQENGLRIAKSLRLSVKKLAVYRAFRTSAEMYISCQCERCKARMAVPEPPIKRRK